MNTRLSLSIACAVIAAVSVPMILRKVPPNPAYGFRTRLTMSSPEIWYPANAFAGWALLVAAAISVAALWLLPERAFDLPLAPLAAFVVPLLLALASSLL